MNKEQHRVTWQEGFDAGVADSADRIAELEADEEHRKDSYYELAVEVKRLKAELRDVEFQNQELLDMIARRALGDNSQVARIAELEAALREIDSVWNGPAGKNYPHNSDAGRAMYDIARRALGGKHEPE